MRRIQIFIPPLSWSGVWCRLHSLSIQIFGHDIIVQTSEVNQKSLHNFYPGFLKDFLAPRIEDSIKKPSICYATVKQGRGEGQGGPATRAVFFNKLTIKVFVSFFIFSYLPTLGQAQLSRGPLVTDKIFFLQPHSGQSYDSVGGRCSSADDCLIGQFQLHISHANWNI